MVAVLEVNMRNLELIIKLIDAVGMKKAYKWLKRIDTSNQYYYTKSKPESKVYFSDKADGWSEGGGWIEIKKKFDK